MNSIKDETLTFVRAWPWWKRWLFRSRYRQAEAAFMTRLTQGLQ